MVEQNKSGTYSEIVYSPFGTKLAIMQGTTLQKAFVPLTGGTTAVYNSSGLAYYRHSDWLGSSRLASTSTRTVYYDGAYGPFGEGYANSGTTDLSFTGMNQDTASNVYDFPAREYGIQGRWPSPDPSGLAAVHIKDPQSLNRYAYVRNNPLRMIDPTGLDCEDSSFRRRSHRGAARLRMRPIAADDDSDDGDCGDDSGDDGGGGGGGGGDCNDDSSCGDDSNDDDDECDAACQQQELDDAESEALAALSNPECAQAVDGGSPAAANTLQNPVSIDSNTLGTIGIADLSALTPKGTVLGSLTIFSGSSSDFGPQSNIEVNSGTPGFFTIYVPGWTYGISQGIFLLHELGHAATNTGTLTSSVQTDSLGSAGVSISVQNNETVGNACFPQGDGPNQGQLDPAAPVAAARRRKHF
jgi:RHS repeat-associated protein